MENEKRTFVVKKCCGDCGLPLRAPKKELLSQEELQSYLDSSFYEERGTFEGEEVDLLINTGSLCKDCETEQYAYLDTLEE